MSRVARVSTVACLLLLLAGVLAYAPGGRARVELTAALAGVPFDLGTWHGSIGVPDDLVPLDAGAPQQVARTYRNGPSTIWLVVGYYPDQRDDARPPAQRLIYPAHGWAGVRTRAVSVPLAEPGAEVSATQVVMRRDDARLAVLYWYQLGPHSVAGDHAYRLRLLYNRLVHDRADMALVRIASPVPPDADADAVVAAQMAFVRSFYPELVRRLPSPIAPTRTGDAR
ncbi:MAG TPA: EpsI family protein [Candidatus Tectomicrobia bacterium]|nr:EpsI family protein [Candidatus Tectomicrobia bacterium]